MSAFFGFLFDRQAYIGTDTLVRAAYEIGDTELRVSHFASKTYHVPQFKSVFAVTGYQDLGLSFFRFLTKHCIGLDVFSIVNINPHEFKRVLDREFSHPIWGTIYLYGLDTAKKQIRGYWLPVNKPDQELTWRPLRKHSQENSGVAMMPMVDDWEDKVIAFDNNKPIDEQDSETDTIVRIIQIQRQEDQRKAIEEQLGIGGEIVVTVIALTQNDMFLIQSHVPYTFPDYLEQGQRMIDLAPH